YLHLRNRGLRIAFQPVELENRAPSAGTGLEPHLAALPRDDSLHDREAHAAAFDLIPGLQRLEHLEDAFGVFLRYAGAVVLDREDEAVVLLLARDHDPSGRPRMMLHRVVDEVQQDLLER